MRIDITLPEGASPPCAAHASDTGYDLIAQSDPVIVGERAGDLWRSISYIEYDTGISVAPDDGGPTITPLTDSTVSITQGTGRHGYLLVYPRSSLSKTNLVLANSVGIVDNSYRGTIKLRFRYLLQPCDLEMVGDDNWSPRGLATRIDQSRIYQRGDKIGQAVAAWKEDIEWRAVAALDDTSRQAGGFGSTDKRSGWKS